MRLTLIGVYNGIRKGVVMQNGCWMQISAFFITLAILAGGFFTITQVEIEPAEAVVVTAVQVWTNTPTATVTPSSTPTNTPSRTSTATVTSTSTPTTAQPILCQVRTNRMELVNIRTEPNLESDLVAQVPNATIMAVYEVATVEGVDVWYRVELTANNAPVMGWVFESLVVPIGDADCPAQ